MFFPICYLSCSMFSYKVIKEARNHVKFVNKEEYKQAENSQHGKRTKHGRDLNTCLKRKLP